MKEKIKEIMPSSIEYIARNIQYIFSRNSSGYGLDKSKKRIFILMAADYGNLGDGEITYAQHCFLEDHFPNHQIIEIPISRTYKDLRYIKKLMNRHDLITITGGGFMMYLYLLGVDDYSIVPYKFFWEK